ncbi:uncharacterized protein LOC110451492 [Mizuhopecten yessoensis]|uniref:uncharacterized protein LOC110451492 n=1 Tax=Mizuhopecten yessoensis TaxID=6573 RepID=UPI000B45D585|nr:uncharacterized protein LOC110451492 [Mizuhopecten yessoensis]
MDSPHFQAETPRGIIASVREGMWATSIDLKDAYFHIPIRKSDRKYLRFSCEGKIFQFRAMPFWPYHSPNGFYQTIAGYQFNVARGIVLPTQEKFIKARSLVLQFIQSSAVQVRWYLSLLGFLNSLADVVPLGRLHIRPLQMFLLSHWVPASRDWEAFIPLSQSVKEFAQWWTIRNNVLKGVSLHRSSPTMTLYTDASKTGWGAYLNGQARSGSWTGDHLSEHINVLEMRAVLLAIQDLRSYLQDQVICVATDNSTVVAYLQKQGGTRSHVLCALAIRILLLCQEWCLTIQVKHLPGRLNVLADTLSRRLQPVLTEWQLDPSIFRAICLVWDRPHVDLFATALNHQLPTFVSPVPDPAAWGVDALSLDWKGLHAYAFPPFNLVAKVLQKYEEQPCSLILVAPLWPRQPWFPQLLSFLVEEPLVLPPRWNLLRQPRSRIMHSRPAILHLHAWRLSPVVSRRRGFLDRCPTVSLGPLGLLPRQSTSLGGASSAIGVVRGRLIHSRPLFP